MKHNLLRKEEDSDPISVVSNLFFVAMVLPQSCCNGCPCQPLQHD